MRVHYRTAILLFFFNSFIFLFCQSADIPVEKPIENLTEKKINSRIKNIVDDSYVIVFLSLIVTLFVAMLTITIATNIKITNNSNKIKQIELTLIRFNSDISIANYRSLVADKEFAKALKWGLDVLLNEYKKKKKNRDHTVIGDFVINVRNLTRKLQNTPTSLLFNEDYYVIKNKIKETSFIFDDLINNKSYTLSVNEIFDNIEVITTGVEESIEKFKKSYPQKKK